MAYEVLAKTGGSLQLAPGSRRSRVRSGSKVVWQYDLAEDDDPRHQTKEGRQELAEARAVLPVGWTIIRKLGVSELSQKLHAAAVVKVDPQQARKGDEVSAVSEKPRGWADADKDLVREAVDALSSKEKEQWTGKGQPSLQAVREIVQLMGEENDGVREWPSWITREVIELATERRRSDGEG